MRKTCPKCGCNFTITSAASVYCQNKDCQNRRRRDDRKAKREGTGAYAPRPGTDAHLAKALKSGA